MNACAKFLVMALVLGSGGMAALAAEHPVPRNRTTLADRDWLPHVISKIAPLEWWSFASSPSDIRRKDYASDLIYSSAKQDTWHFPRFCFSFFRAKAEAISSLLKAANDYKGDVAWSMSDYCITAVPGLATSSHTPMTAMPDRQELEEFLRNPPKVDPEFVKRAMADAPTFAAYLEERLGLRNKPSLDFDPQWLTREGLAASRGQFEEYVEPGEWTVFLALRPQEYAQTQQPTSAADRSLAFGVGMDQATRIVDELGAKWETDKETQLSKAVLPGFPLLSRLPDFEGSIYEPGEVSALLAECVRAQEVVRDPESIRGLDNLVRIARWAKKLQLGIYFEGQ